MLQKDKWIIDGFGPWEFVEKRFREADAIIYVDLPLIMHYYWATKRQLKCLFKPRIDGPPGCPMLPVTFKLYKMMWHLHKEIRPKLHAKRIIHLKNKERNKRVIKRVDVELFRTSDIDSLDIINS